MYTVHRTLHKNMSLVASLAYNMQKLWSNSNREAEEKTKLLKAIIVFFRANIICSIRNYHLNPLPGRCIVLCVNRALHAFTPHRKRELHRFYVACQIFLMYLGSFVRDPLMYSGATCNFMIIYIRKTSRWLGTWEAHLLPSISHKHTKRVTPPPYR